MSSHQTDKENCFTERRQESADSRRRTRRSATADRRLGLNRRRGPGRRRTEDRKAAEEGQMTDEQFEFLMAVDQYKKVNSRPFPTWTEILELIKALGYRKVADPCGINQVENQEPVETNG
ncbi:MAG: hypothetical protein JW806_10005 [Sedimentisphaerales bacterium]|nr:hypothetical protein [Sedimentisphaerales bacterium]